MKVIRNEILDLYDNLFIYWFSMKPRYFRLGLRDLFEIDIDIFSEIFNII